MSSKILLWAACFGAFACNNMLPPSSRIIKPRLLGAKVSVVGDPSRAQPNAGEMIDVEWPLVSEAAFPAMAHASIACVTAPSAFGVPACAGPAFGFDGSPVPIALADGVARHRFTLPADSEGRGLSLVAVFCPDAAIDVMSLMAGGRPDPATLCEDGAEALVATLSFVVGGESNAHPSLGELTLVGEAWPEIAAPGVPGDACDALSIPQLTMPAVDAEETTFEIGLETTGFESYTVMRGDPPMPETVEESFQITILTTQGETGPRFVFTESDATDEMVDWEPDPDLADSLPAEGTLVAFHITARDGRNGFDWKTRFACLKPR